MDFLAKIEIPGIQVESVRQDLIRLIKLNPLYAAIPRIRKTHDNMISYTVICTLCSNKENIDNKDNIDIKEIINSIE